MQHVVSQIRASKHPDEAIITILQTFNHNLQEDLDQDSKEKLQKSIDES